MAYLDPNYGLPHLCASCGRGRGSSFARIEVTRGGETTVLAVLCVDCADPARYSARQLAQAVRDDLKAQFTQERTPK